MTNWKAKNVVFFLKARFENAEGEEEMEMDSVGTYFHAGNRSRLIYEEKDWMGNGEYQGQTVLEVDGDRQVTIERSGLPASQMIIEKGNRHLCQYGTEYGDLLLGIAADDIQNKLGPHGGTIHFGYSLDVNMALASVNRVEIRIKERREAR